MQAPHRGELPRAGLSVRAVDCSRCCDGRTHVAGTRRASLRGPCARSAPASNHTADVGQGGRVCATSITGLRRPNAPRPATTSAPQGAACASTSASAAGRAIRAAMHPTDHRLCRLASAQKRLPGWLRRPFSYLAQSWQATKFCYSDMMHFMNGLGLVWHMGERRSRLTLRNPVEMSIRRSKRFCVSA